jgi:hypothetical protein
LKKILLLLCGMLILFDTAHAKLITIGTAGYDSDGDGIIATWEQYNLILDDDNNGNSVVWLDYTNGGDGWEEQNLWAAGVGSKLTINLNSGISVDWENNSWRLPSVGLSPTTGYNVTDSEIGHLFYDELKLQSYVPIENNFTVSSELNSSNFDNLIAQGYWTDAEYADNTELAWYHDLSTGSQNRNAFKGNRYSGLAIRTGKITIPYLVFIQDFTDAMSNNDSEAATTAINNLLSSGLGSSKLSQELFDGIYQALGTAVADAEAVKDVIIVQKDQTIASMFTQTQLDTAILTERELWDKNGDGKVGIEEAIHALKIVAGRQSE